MQSDKNKDEQHPMRSSLFLSRHACELLQSTANGSCACTLRREYTPNCIAFSMGDVQVLEYLALHTSSCLALCAKVFYGIWDGQAGNICCIMKAPYE